jgi:hypothetical protein
MIIKIPFIKNPSHRLKIPFIKTPSHRLKIKLINNRRFKSFPKKLYKLDHHYEYHCYLIINILRSIFHFH